MKVSGSFVTTQELCSGARAWNRCFFPLYEQVERQKARYENHCGYQAVMQLVVDCLTTTNMCIGLC